MNDLNQPLTFTALLGNSFHRQAEKFSQQHCDRAKAQQVYLNTLAVCAVQYYFQCMGIETNQETSDSWDPIQQALLDVADLTLPYYGKVECRPVLPDTTTMQIPPEVWCDRIGYIAVQLEPSLRTATLLGYTPSAGNGEIVIRDLRSLDDFLNHLQPLSAPIPLSQWLEGIMAAGWRSLDELLGTQPQLALSFRGDATRSKATVRRAKLLNLGLQLAQQSAALLVAVTPETEQTLGISVQLHPATGETYLPSDLRLQLLTESGDSLQEVRSRSQDNYIQLKRFHGLPGESFKIQLTWGEVNLTESFVI